MREATAPTKRLILKDLYYTQVVKKVIIGFKT
jgi:hypothetical protein